MAILRQIAQLGQPVLRQVAEKITDPKAAEVQALIEDMLVTVAEAEGVGIAAPQVFVSQSLFIMALQPNARYPQAPRQDPQVVINPEIVRVSEDMEKGWEGCLSVPGLRGLVPRHRRVAVRYLDRNGEHREEELEGFPARVFHHEFDHVQGMVFLDRVESSRELISEKEYFRRLKSHA